MLFDKERFWNIIIQFSLKHIHRRGGIHQDTFYRILDKMNKMTMSAQIMEYDTTKGWEE